MQSLPRHIVSLLNPYFPELDLSDIRIHTGIPWYVAMAADAYTDCHNIYFAPGKYDTETVSGIALIGHEVTHCWQYHRYGKWKFRGAYSERWARKFIEHRSWVDAYFHNPFEVEAREMERQIYFDLLKLIPNGETHERLIR